MNWNLVTLVLLTNTSLERESSHLHNSTPHMHMSSHRFSPLLTALLLTTASLTLLPADAVAQEENMALKNYEKAKQAYGAGEFELAAELLQKAYAEDPDLIYQYNRIRALQAMGNYDEALKTIELFRGPMQRDKDQRFTDLDELEAQIKAEKIEFEKTQQPDVKEPETKDPETKDPDTKDVKDPDEPDVKEPEPPTPTVLDPVKLEEERQKKRSTGWILLGTGALAVAGTSPFWSASRLRNTEACFGASNVDQPECFNESQAQQDFNAAVLKHRIIGGAGLGVGAILGVTGIIMIIKNRPTDQGDASSSNVTFSPSISRQGAGAQMFIRF